MQKEILALFNLYAEEHSFSGAGLVKKGDDIICANAYGLAHRGFKVPNEINTMFDTASVTKLFTAVAILQLVDKGLVNLDDRVTNIIDLSGTQIPTDVTVRHLLTHTSGIADDADEEDGESYEELFINKPNYSIRNCIDFIPQFAYKEPKFNAGTKVSYNNCAFVLLGLVIEKVSKNRYRDYVTEHIFRICDMQNTSFSAKDDADTRVAEGYSASTNERNEVIWKKNIYSFPPIGTSDGGAFTTVGDLDLFIRALISGKLLSQEMTTEMIKPQTTIEQKYDWGKIVNGYGFHFSYNKSDKLIRMYKEGSNAGVAVMFAYYPEIDTTSIILANQTCNVWELHRKVEQHLLAGS
ncbi:beta-lactamase family protein [Paenibacillus sp. GSMTC-2017]|uniref:serine hydrolase domain-containing protein n=1 Tax=Paenibacillus sp. GSMTC-2017 TaxID=2794350 RepID=UPI0018D9624E|nr:serine hydrolase domain-containing protein [Paenibacillus sp. GSMTC-2017]MBH5318833.1 beta-lactamase family protein [Paenibacillus sp. GSMTC-2017]